ncbi:MAG TPA: TonB-dependent receptor [Thermoanaerobaculia bacterium]|nr:TonB-dependent receptor [Thermoanaerobaculia bacterium]
MAVIAAWSFLLASPGTSAGQAPGYSARVEGRVTDAAGMPIAAAQIAVTGLTGTMSTRTVTGVSGTYWAPSLPPGRYSVEATAAGHASSVMEDVDLEAGETLRLDFTLAEGGERSFTITSAPTLDTVSPEAPPALGPVALQRLPVISAGRWAATRAGAAVEPPPGLGLERVRLHQAPLGSSRRRIAGAEVTGLLDDTLLFDHAVLHFDELQVRDLDAKSERGTALGGWIDAVPRWSDASWTGRARVGWASDEPVLVFTAAPAGGATPRIPDPPGQATGDGLDVGISAGGPVGGSTWLFFGGGDATLILDGVSDRLERDIALARVAWSPPARDPVRLEAEIYEAVVERPTLVGEGVPVGPPGGSPGATLGGDMEATASVLRLGLDWVASSSTWRAEALAGQRTDQPASYVSPGTITASELEQRRDSLVLSTSRLLRGRSAHTLDLGARWTAEEASLRSSLTRGGDRAENEISAAWLEDRWRAGRRGTFTLGLRAQQQRARSDAAAGSLDLGTALESRLGGALDVYGDGTWKVYGVVSHGEAKVDPALLLASTSSVLPLRVDPDVAAPTVLAAAVGSEQLVVGGVVLSARLGYWAERDPLLRLLRLEDGESFVLVANPARGLDAAAAAELPSNLQRDVEILQLALAVRLSFSEEWEFGGSYAWSRVDGALDRELLGQDPGCGFVPACTTTSRSVVPSALERPHRLELHGSHRFAPGFWGGFVFTAAEGTPFVPLRAAPASPWLGETQLVADPGAAGHDRRNDASAQLDMSAGWEVAIGARPYRLAFELSAFNVFDERRTMERWPFAEIATLALGDPLVVQEGRWVRFGVRLEL